MRKRSVIRWLAFWCAHHRPSLYLRIHNRLVTRRNSYYYRKRCPKGAGVWIKTYNQRLFTHWVAAFDIWKNEQKTSTPTVEFRCESQGRQSRSDVYVAVVRE